MKTEHPNTSRLQDKPIVKGELGGSWGRRKEHTYIFYTFLCYVDYFYHVRLLFLKYDI